MSTSVAISVVARAAGVSKSTVSRVLAGKGNECRIATATQARVRATAIQLGYEPNPIARDMALGKGVSLTRSAVTVKSITDTVPTPVSDSTHQSVPDPVAAPERQAKEPIVTGVDQTPPASPTTVEMTPVFARPAPTEVSQATAPTETSEPEPIPQPEPVKPPVTPDPTPGAPPAVSPVAPAPEADTPVAEVTGNEPAPAAPVVVSQSPVAAGEVARPLPDQTSVAALERETEPVVKAEPEPAPVLVAEPAPVKAEPVIAPERQEEVPVTTPAVNVPAPATEIETPVTDVAGGEPAPAAPVAVPKSPAAAAEEATPLPDPTPVPMSDPETKTLAKGEPSAVEASEPEPAQPEEHTAQPSQY